VERTGKCMCGAVKYTAKELKTELGACHCEMCRQWTGGPLLSFSSRAVDWTGEDKITTFKSSDWAERAFCSVCGSGLFYRVTAPGPYQGQFHIPFGTLDDQSGFEMNVELFIDKKPDAYALEGERKKLTAQQVFEMFGGG